MARSLCGALGALAALALAAPGAAGQAPLRLSFAEAVRRAAAAAPRVELAGLRTAEAGARGARRAPARGVARRVVAQPHLQLAIPRNLVPRVPGAGRAVQQLRRAGERGADAERPDQHREPGERDSEGL